MATIISTKTSGVGGLTVTGDASGVLELASANGTTAVTIDASQNVSFTKAINKAALPTGSVLQVVTATYSTQTSNATSTAVNTGLSATITPTSSTSKILVIVDQNGCGKDTGDTALICYLYRNSTQIADVGILVGYTGTTNATFIGSSSATCLDSPATTSATTYKTQFYSWQNKASVWVQFAGSTSTITLMEIAA